MLPTAKAPNLCGPSSSEKAQPRSPATAAAVQSEQGGCGRHCRGDEERSPRGIQSLSTHPQRFLLGMPGRRAGSQQAENRSDCEIDTQQNERGRNGLDT
jgi:hypothetical protein